LAGQGQRAAGPAQIARPGASCARKKKPGCHDDKPGFKAPKKAI
jgi:hypothetical protein